MIFLTSMNLTTVVFIFVEDDVKTMKSDVAKTAKKYTADVSCSDYLSLYQNYICTLVLNY
jgi:hypothetical protein